MVITSLLLEKPTSRDRGISVARSLGTFWITCTLLVFTDMIWEEMEALWVNSLWKAFYLYPKQLMEVCSSNHAQVITENLSYLTDKDLLDDLRTRKEVCHQWRSLGGTYQLITRDAQEHSGRYTNDESAQTYQRWWAVDLVERMEAAHA